MLEFADVSNSARHALKVSGQTYPARPIRVVVPFWMGGGTDIATRAVAQKLPESFAQQVIVENRPGAASAEQFSAMFRNEIATWANGVKAAGVRAD